MFIAIKPTPMRIILVAITVTVLFASCTTAEFIQHTPTLANTGQHTGKDQFSGKLLYSTGNTTSTTVVNALGATTYEKVNGIQTQGSYSISNALAVQASFMHSGEAGGSEDQQGKHIVYKYNRNITEAGLAWYKSLNKEKNLFIEIGGGTGFGSFKTTEAASATVTGGRYYDHNVFKLYLQPALYYAIPNLSVGIGAKYAYINFNNIKTNYTDPERSSRSITTNNSLNTTTLDLFFTARFSFSKLPWLGFYFQSLHSEDLNKKFNYNQMDNNYGIGLNFLLGQFFEAKKDK